MSQAVTAWGAVLLRISLLAPVTGSSREPDRSLLRVIPPLPGDQIDVVPSRNSILQCGRGYVLDFFRVSPRDNSCGSFPDLVIPSERDKT